MKPKYLDLRNCKSLLPKHTGIPIERQLEEYLDITNKGTSGHEDIIDELIKHNEKTTGKKSRFYKSVKKFDISIVIHMARQGFMCTTIDRPTIEPFKLHLEFAYENGTHWIVTIPLQYLLKGWGDANNGYQCYLHVVAQNIKPQRVSMYEIKTRDEFLIPARQDAKEYYYFGITGRNWLQRFDEHMREVQKGSKRRFHQTWKDNFGIENALYSSTLMYVNLTKDEAYNWEEGIIDEHETVTGEHGLNMIPGGYKGIRELHKCKIIKDIDISPEERDEATGELIRQFSRKGKPAPWMAEYWGIKENYLNYINSREDTLSDDDVRRIRTLAKDGMSPEDILKETVARNLRQVKDVISRKYYDNVED